MVWVDKAIAGLVLVICIGLFIRLCLGQRLRSRLDGVCLRSFYASRRQLREVMGWRTRRKYATREAEEAIERARRGSWEGNVYSTRSFKDKPRKPH